MPDTALVQKIPDNKLQSKQLVNWTAMDLCVLAILLTLVITIGVWLGEVVGLLSAVCLMPILVRSPKGYGRMYYEMARSFVGLHYAYVLKGVLWQADDDSSKLIRWLRRRGYRMRGKRSVIPLGLGTVQATVRGKEERFSLLHHLDRPYDHMFISSEGGAFSNLDLSQQQRAVDMLANLTNQVIAQTNLKVGISYLRITGPHDPSPTYRYLRQNMNPVIASPQDFELDEAQRSFANWMQRYANYLEPVSNNNGAAKNRFLIIITIKRTSEWGSARRGRLSDKQLYDLPIAELGRAMVDSLSSNSFLGLKDVHCLSLAELSTTIRAAWDVAGIQDYYNRKSRGEIPTTDEQIDAIRAEYGNRGVDQALQTWPSQRIAVNQEHSYLQMDGNFISVLRAVKLPEQVQADQYLSLHYTPKARVWTRQGMVGQAVSGEAETQQLIVGRSALLNFEAAFYSRRIVRDPRKAHRENALKEQTETFSLASIAQHYHQLHTVVAANEDDLLKQRKELKSALNAAGFRTEIVTGVSRQLDAGITAMLGINRL